MTLPIDRIFLVLLLGACLFLGGRTWLHDHPQDNPWAALTLDEPQGWATSRKWADLRAHTAQCRAFLERSDIPATPLSPVGTGQCRRDDRQALSALSQFDVALRPRGAQATCAVDAGMAWWLIHGIQPAARRIFGSRVVRIEHLGTYNCRRIGGGSQGRWSEHVHGNALDVAAFVLANGRRISVLKDWPVTGKPAAEKRRASQFLHAVRDSACTVFSTVLSPDYNVAHANHLHLDQASRSGGWRACR